MAIEEPQKCKAIHITTVLTDWEPQSIFTKIKMTFDYIFK